MIDHVAVEKVDNIYVQVHAEDSILQEMSEFFTFSTPGYQFSPAFKSRHWDGKIRLLNLRTKQIYAGLVGYIKTFCKQSIQRIFQMLSPFQWSQEIISYWHLASDLQNGELYSYRPRHQENR
jgi:hypothetical protein